MPSRLSPLALALLLILPLLAAIPPPCPRTEDREEWWGDTTAQGRNAVSAAIIQHGELENHPAWLLGIDGTNVVIASADSGIDRDHACFRDATEPGASGSEWNNATGTPGEAHRKIIFLSEDIDDWDTEGHQHYTHGTHVAASLVCRSIHEQAAEYIQDWANATPGEGTSLSHGAKLAFHDVVGDEGWMVPSVGTLFYSAADNGAVIRSDSWGDKTTEYTKRTADFDTWLHSVPWSISFVAPGNTGNEVQEPANGFNVVSVGVAKRDDSGDIWMLSPNKPTEQGRRGVEFVVPGTSITSASADGEHNSYNDGWKSNTGTSMATPQAAAAAALIQQMVQEGWIGSSGERSTEPLHRPGWASQVDGNLSEGKLLLGDGFTPSGSLIRALLSLSAESMEGGRHGSIVLGYSPDDSQGWGLVNISKLVDFGAIEGALGEHPVDPSPHLWVHDSFRLDDDDWGGLIESWIDGNPLDSVADKNWRGEGGTGPFLATGDSQSWVMPLVGNEDLEVRLAWTSSPTPDELDDLDLIVRVGDEWYHGNQFDGWNSSSTLTEVGGDKGQTLEGIRISADRLVGVDNITVLVTARNVNDGPNKGGVGMNGDRIGFALVVEGVDRNLVTPEFSWEPFAEIEQYDDGLVIWGILVAVLVIVALVALEARWGEELFEEGSGVTEGQPSNHEGDSLALADAPQTGEEE